MQSNKLETVEVCKTYPGTIALNNISLGFEAGKVHALIGKNGAGKSTLVKIFSGAIEPTSGKILVDGKQVRIQSPRDAFEKGIATVYQELSLIPELTIAENILFGRLPTKPNFGNIRIDWPETYRQAKGVLDRLQVDLDIRKKVSEYGVAQQQVVEIAKAMSFNPSVLILDEPTSALAHHEVETLFSLIKKLAKQGVAIIYISHRLQELYEVADMVSVIRDGSLVGTMSMGDATPEKMVQMMFGETVQKNRPPELSISEERVMEVRNVTRHNKLEDITFSLYKGEVLGIAGLVGSGRTELLRILMGADPFDSGKIIVKNKIVYQSSPSVMKRLGVGFTPENRKEQGLVQILNTRMNLSLAGLDRVSSHGIMNLPVENQQVRQNIQDLQIAVSDTEQAVSSLSGGNQQKVVVGNWLNTQPQIMLFDEPTRGIDLQAKQQIFEIIWDLSKKGISSIFVSSELEEVLEVCHRILILQKGRIIGEVKPQGLTLETLYKSCIEGVGVSA